MGEIHAEWSLSHAKPSKTKKKKKKTLEKFGPHLRKTTFEKVKISPFECRSLTFEKYKYFGPFGKKEPSGYFAFFEGCFFEGEHPEVGFPGKGCRQHWREELVNIHW